MVLPRRGKRLPAKDAADEEAILPVATALQANEEVAVIDWGSEPDPAIATAYNLLHRPAFMTNSAKAAGAVDATAQARQRRSAQRRSRQRGGGVGGGGRQARALTRVPIDRGALKTTPHPTGGDSPGWIDADGAHEYPLLSTGPDDLGAIGGVGMRLYYWVLMRLALLFLALGTVSIPALRAYDRGEMFNHPAASRFADVLGAKQSLGALVASDEDIEVCLFH